MAGVSTTRVPTKACVFIQEFKKSSKAGDRVSVWERVVYSLIEANHQTTELRAPAVSNVDTTSYAGLERA
jgi:hypothetical protein